MLVIDVEPSVERNQTKNIALQDLNTSFKFGKQTTKEYKLCAVIEYRWNISHFVAYVRVENGEWMLYDDLRNTGIKTDGSVVIRPFMLFYYTSDGDSGFKKAFRKKVLVLCVFR